MFSLRAKERQQQKQQMTANHPTTIQDLMLPIIPIIPSPIPLPSDIAQDQQNSSILMKASEDPNHDMYQSLSIKDEKTELFVNPSSPVLKARTDFSVTTLMAKSIDQRRDEVNGQSIASKKKTILPTSRSSRSTQRKMSSSSTDIELRFNCRSPSPTSTNILPTIEDEEDIVESKSFIHNLDFNIHTLLERKE